MSLLRAPFATHDSVDRHIILNQFVHSISTVSIGSTLKRIVHHPFGGENHLIVIAPAAGACGWIFAAVVDAARAHR